MTPEILAPVGGKEQLDAAIRAGADAVYLGTQSFNARRNAQNFTAGELPAVVSACHRAGVRVHVTFNTLLSDRELPAALAEIEKIADSGADAVIVQDPGAAKLFRDNCPSLPLHASTQMTIHDAEGALAARELGFSRVVLARELSLREIESIGKAAPGVELEVFVHGALCVSLSGACYLSAMLGGRSGNRGLCAGPCRLDFRARGRDYALSLKDLSAMEYLPELARIGVSSFKIEGRMKGPAYVAAAVAACREKLAGREPDMDLLERVFSRSGFTAGYLAGKTDVRMFGRRTREDAAETAAAGREAALLTRTVYRKVPLSFSLSLARGAPSLLSVTDGKNAVEVRGPLPLPPRARPTGKEEAEKHLSKTGGTPYFLDSLDLSNPADFALPPSALNAMRREALTKLDELRGRAAPHAFAGKPLSLPALGPHGPVSFRIAADEAETLLSLSGEKDAGSFLLPAAKVTREVADRFGGRLIARVPPVSFESDRARTGKLLDGLKALGVENVSVSGLGTLRMARARGFRIHGDFGLNIYNSLSLEEYRKAGLSSAVVSFELSARDVERLGGPLPRGIVGYGRLPLMRFRACPGRGKDGCGACPGSFVLSDRKGISFPVSCDGRRYSTMYNSVPLYVGDRLPRGIDFVLLEFAGESPEEARRILDLFRRGEKPDFPRTAGLYYRETL